VRRIVTPLLVIALGAILTAPAAASTRGCDATGDRRPANDCLRHTHVGASKDGRVKHGEVISIRPRLHHTVHGRATTLIVQARRIDRKGTKGPWLDIRRVRWPANASPRRTIHVCSAALAGRYQFRVVAPARAARQGSASATMTSNPVSVTLPRGSTPGACPTTSTDESNIEYFNLLNYMEEFTITASATASATTISLGCPPATEGIGQTLAVGVFLVGQDVGAGCTTGPISLAAATLAAGGYPQCVSAGTTSRCNFEIWAWNSESGSVYSTTVIQIVLPAPGRTSSFVPQLLPATLPVCVTPLNPCLASGSCPTTPLSSIKLCESPTSCAMPSAPSTFDYNDTIYFQRAVPPAR